MRCAAARRAPAVPDDAFEHLRAAGALRGAGLLDLGERLVAAARAAARSACSASTAACAVLWSAATCSRRSMTSSRGVLQAGLPALEGSQLVLQLLELFWVAHRPGVQQIAVPVLALAHRVDLGLQLGDLRVEVLQSQDHDRQSVGGLPALDLHLVVALLLGKVGGTVRQAAQFRVQIDQSQQRLLLCGISFHDRLSGTRYSRVGAQRGHRNGERVAEV